MTKYLLLSLCMLSSGCMVTGISRQSANGVVTTTIARNTSGKVVSKYDQFRTTYLLKWNDSSSVSSLTFNKSEFGITIVAYQSRGDLRYTVPRSGSLDFKFDDGTIYTFSGKSVCLSTVFVDINRITDSEFLLKLANSKYVYIQIKVVGSCKTIRVPLSGAEELLRASECFPKDLENS